MTEGEQFKGHRRMCQDIIAWARLITELGHGSIRIVNRELEDSKPVRATKQRRSAHEKVH